jgi:hypothetical protein
MADYKIGRGKPPRHTQFMKGISGNPRGRPKGRRNFSTTIEETLSEVQIEENGQKRTVTRLSAATRRLVDKATSSDMSAIRWVITLMPADNSAKTPTSAELEKGDRKVLEILMRRFTTTRRSSEM